MFLNQKIHPASLRIDASTICQLKCPLCQTGRGENKGTIGNGYLRFRDFRELVDANRFISHIELANWGEIFLNPELPRIVKYAQERGLTLTAETGVNLNYASDAALEALVRYSFQRLTCAIDGASAGTYRIYRQGGDFDAVIGNVRKINSLKRKYQIRFPALSWQFVVFGHNEHEIPAARKMAQELGMEFYVRLSWDDDFSPVRDSRFLQRVSGHRLASRKEFRTKLGKSYRLKLPCCQLWNKPQLNWDGRVLGCCVNRRGDFGNAFSSGLEAALNSEKMLYAREMLMGKRPPRDDLPCFTCRNYREICITDVFVTWHDVLVQRGIDWLRRRFIPAYRFGVCFYPHLIRWF